MDSKHGDSSSTWKALSLAFELGYLIAIPLVVLALGGRLLDRNFGSSPIFLLSGIFLSVIISGLLVYRKSRTIMNEVTDIHKK